MLEVASGAAVALRLPLAAWLRRLRYGFFVWRRLLLGWVRVRRGRLPRAITVRCGTWLQPRGRPLVLVRLRRVDRSHWSRAPRRIKTQALAGCDALLLGESYSTRARSRNPTSKPGSDFEQFSPFLRRRNTRDGRKKHRQLSGGLRSRRHRSPSIEAATTLAANAMRSGKKGAARNRSRCFHCWFFLVPSA